MRAAGGTCPSPSTWLVILSMPFLPALAFRSLNPRDAQMPREAKPNSDIENTASLTADLSRRGFIATASAAAAGGIALAQGPAGAAIVRTHNASLPPYGDGTLA